MNKYLLLFPFLSITSILFGQTTSAKYIGLIKKADNFYHLKNYKVSATTFTQAFKLNKWKVPVADRYNAACAWALAEMPDSAFYQLNYIVNINLYTRYEQITKEHDLNGLHKDKRWKPLLAAIKLNSDKKEAKLNKPLIRQLDTILKGDQDYRHKIKEVQENFGMDSDEMRTLWKTINEKDSIDLIKVKSILDQYGWLGADVVGEEGNSTLFLVIQHSAFDVQLHYLPIMQEAVKKGNAVASDLALLEDRVALKQGKKQIYGSQITEDPKTGKDTMAPIEDFANVDKRRAEVGLGPLEEYVSQWGIKYKIQKKEIVSLRNVSNDFATAMDIHDSIVGPTNVQHGYGIQQDIRIDKDMKEENSAWYKFTIGFDTVLTFDLVPNNPIYDYDFVLFKCPDASCLEKIRAKKVLPDRWCFSVNYDKYGSTGLSEYADATHVGAGDGVGYVAGLPVKAGETIYLMVNWPANYSYFPKGYTIYFYNYWPHKPKEELRKKLQKKPIALVLENVLFETNTTVLLKESEVALNKLVNELNMKKTMKIEIRGHTDNVGNEVSNQKLSEERAKSIVDYIVSKGIDKNRLTYKGFGSKQPITTNDTDEGRKKNRRAEFIITAH